MKKYLIFIYLVLATLNCKAFDDDLPRVDVGLRTSFLTSYNSLADNTTGFVMPGLSFDVKMGNIPLYIESGVYYTRLNYAEKINVDDIKYGVISGEDNSLLIPLLASWHIGLDSKLVLQPFLGFLYGYGFDSHRSYAGGRLGCGLSFKHFYTNIGFDALGILSSSNTFHRNDDAFEQISRGNRHDDWDWDWDCDWDPNFVGNFFITLGINFTSY